MRLDSDFNDYYDSVLTQITESEGIYIRKLSQAKGKHADLSFLKSLGFETIALKPVSNATLEEKLIVYTDPKGHMGKGKVVVKGSDAHEIYSNYVCSSFIEGNEYTYKVLQIGYKRFSLKILNDGLKEKEIVSFELIGEDLFEAIKSPIYSIDYVRCGDRMLACDFNQVQKLSHIDMDKYLPPSVIVNELHKYYSNRGKV